MSVKQSMHNGASQDRPNRANGGRFARNPSTRQVKLTLKVRRQSPQEARQYSAAYALLVAELVRAELAPPKD